MSKTEKDAAQTVAETEKTADKVSIHLFRDNERYKDDVFVCVNGKTALIQRGKTVEVSADIAEALENSMQQDAATADMIGREVNRSLAQMERGGIN